MGLAQENALTADLNRLVKEGLLTIEQSVPVIVREPMSTTIRVMGSVRLVLREQEYIERLERENKELRDIIDGVKTSLKSHE